MGVFSEHIQEYLDHNVVGLPIDGKKPMVINPAKFRAASVKKIANNPRFKHANIGFLCGNDNGITVIDIDDSDRNTLREIVSLCGDTPIITQTPSGGFHLWYKNNGEARKVRQLPGYDVDVLGRGLCVAPPSVRRGTGQYHFIEGDLDDLSDLPRIKAGALPVDFYSCSLHAAPSQAIARNEGLFKHLVGQAKQCVSVDVLKNVAVECNQQFPQPLPSEEMLRVVKSVWKYKERDQLWSGGEAHSYFSNSEMRDLDPDSFYLLGKLRLSHGARKGDFILANALAVELGWSLSRYRKSKKNLITQGYLKMTCLGGRGKNDPPMAKLT